MRVIHLISGLMYGGGQKVALDLVDGLSSLSSINAELWLLGCHHDVLRERATFVTPYSGSYSSPITLVATALRVRKHLKASPADVVHSHGWDADIIAFLATLGRHEARVIHLHVTPNWLYSKAVKHRVRRRLTSLMFAGVRVQAIAVADRVREHWIGSLPHLAPRTTVVLNCVDTNVFSPPSNHASEKAVRLGVACRLVPHKGLDVLLRALPSVLERSKAPICVKIAGEGPQAAQLSRLVSDLGLSGHVKFCGHVSNMAEFYRMIDIFILPAVSDEGLPLAVLEAMATGLPVIATDVGGTCEAVRHGIDGLLVPAGSQEALSTSLCELVDNFRRRTAMGRSALARAQSVFSPEVQCEAIAMRYLTATSTA